MPTLLRHRNGVYYIVLTINGKRIWRSLQTKSIQDAYPEYLRQSKSKSTSKSPSLTEAKTEYLLYVKANLSQATFDHYRNVFAQFERFTGNRSVEEITTRDMDAYKVHRSGSVTAHTVNHELRGLRAFFKRLVIWGIIQKSPCENIRDIRITETTRPYLTKEDLRKLLAHTEGTQLHDIILLATMTGLRRGEMTNLRWADLDFERGVIQVRSSATYRTKAGKLRSVPMNGVVRSLLTGLKQEGEFVFPGDRGGPYNGDFLSRRFKRAVLACGLNKKLHIHSCRHTFASLLVQDGVSLYHVQRLMGHSSIRVTEIYAHLGHAELASSVERLSL